MIGDFFIKIYGWKRLWENFEKNSWQSVTLNSKFVLK
ncbi:hypothetical protein KAOT1_14797 [Kordia algicida OT-1]|uniref:Uncharacterized protein n=1 Tax=Kordia algicida OT-1 TaxID=391587 RepID=A9DL71_9FLAO|nr:hypothetical protein KAOT1_14797 [Kordia algicida OT-1]